MEERFLTAWLFFSILGAIAAESPLLAIILAFPFWSLPVLLRAFDFTHLGGLLVGRQSYSRFFA